MMIFLLLLISVSQQYSLELFNYKLYTWLPMKIKMDEKRRTCGTQFSINFWRSIKTISPLHPLPFQECSGIFFYMLTIEKVMGTTVSSFFPSNPNMYLCLDRSLHFHINIGIHAIKTGEKLASYKFVF